MKYVEYNNFDTTTNYIITITCKHSSVYDYVGLTTYICKQTHKNKQNHILNIDIKY